MKKRSNWLIVATMMLISITCTPVHAEETPVTEVNLSAEITEIPTESVEVPVEQPIVAETTPTDEATALTYVPIVPTLLVDRLDPEIYATLEDPNVKIVLVDISDQYVWAFENGSSVLESPMISGLANTRRETSRGVFSIKKKIPGKRLRGPKGENGKPAWDCWVDYWMLFDSKRSIGLHDASWRTPEQYVVDTYTTNGSRGCVNLPCDFAPLLYDVVEIGTPVIVQD